jgi:hypothetical protein
MCFVLVQTCFRVVFDPVHSLDFEGAGTRSAPPRREIMKRTTTLIGIIVATLLLLPATAFAAGQGAGGVSGVGAFYVDGVAYRTVGTPTDLSNTGAPDHSFDTIYVVGNGQTNVATAAPGDEDYNGGRWQVEVLDFGDTGYAMSLADHDYNGSGTLDSAEEIAAALAAGYATASAGPTFVCPVIPAPRG